jgi:hypothetical protein
VLEVNPVVFHRVSQRRGFGEDPLLPIRTEGAGRKNFDEASEEFFEIKHADVAHTMNRGEFQGSSFGVPE